MQPTAAEFQNTWKLSLQKIKTVSPEIARSFGGLHLSVMKEGVLTTSQKEMIALAIGLTQGCTDCIYLHTEGALKAGASKEQVMEAAAVAVMMQGGPAFVHLPAVIASVDHFVSPGA